MANYLYDVQLFVNYKNAGFILFLTQDCLFIVLSRHMASLGLNGLM